MKNSQGLDINKIAELQFAFGQIYDENFKPRDKAIYSKEIKNFNEKLNEIGIDSKLTPKQIELKLQQLYEILIKVPKFADQTPNDKIKEAPRPEAQTANTVSEKGNEQIFRDLEKRNEELKKTREEAKRVVQNAKIRQKEIYKEKEKLRASEIENEQKQIESDIQEAQNVQKELENKKIYAKITVPAIPELTQEEKQDLQILEDFAKDPKTRTELIEDLTQEIEERIKPTLKEATENEIKIITRTSAVDIVEKIANPEARQKAQEENIQTAVYQSLTTNPKVIKEVVKEAKPLQSLKKGSVVLAYYANEQNATTQIIAGNLFDSKFKRIFYGPNFKEIRVEYSEKPIQGQTNYIVDIGSVNSEFINLQQKSNTLLEKLKSFGIEESRSYISTQVGIYFKEKVATMPEGVVKKAYSSPILQSFLSKYGIAEPVVWQAIGQNQVVGILMKVTPETAGPVLSIAGKALGIEIVKPITTQIAKEAGKEVVVQATKEVGKKAASGAIAKVIGTAVGPFSAIPVVGPILNWLFAEIVVRGLGELWSKFKVWWSKNKENIAPFLAVGAGLSLARFGIGPAILGGAGTFLMFGGTASALLFGPLRFFAILGRNIGITIATPVIVTLLIIPPLVAFIMLIINNSAYVVPYSYESGSGVGVVPEACLGEPPPKPIATNIKYSSDGKYAYPVAPFETPGYSCYHWDGNKAADIFSPQDKPPLLAYESGVIVNVTLDDDIGGKYIILKGNTSGRHYYYAHLCHVFVQSGDSVNVGDVIGSMDETGSGRVQHLHYAINKSPLSDTFIGGDGNVCPQEDFEQKFGFNVCRTFCVNP